MEEILDMSKTSDEIGNLQNINLEPYIQVYGNEFSNNCYFLALQFKKPVVIYNAVNSIPIEIPNNFIILLKGSCFPPIAHKKTNSLIYYCTDEKTPHFRKLLLMLLPSDSVIISYYNNSTLYVVTERNPFKSFWIKCRKDIAFRSLYILYCNWRSPERKFSLHDVALFRHFKTIFNPKTFSGWFPLVHTLCCKKCYQTWGVLPSINLGNKIYNILERSAYSPCQLPPLDFYSCELLMVNEEPVGISYLMKGSELLYVSPMIVARIPEKEFRDSNFITCNNWMPLYKNYATWNSFGLSWFVNNLDVKILHLKAIISWVLVPKVEKYKLIYLDLMHIAKILVGDESKHFLKE